MGWGKNLGVMAVHKLQCEVSLHPGVSCLANRFPHLLHYLKTCLIWKKTQHAFDYGMGRSGRRPVARIQFAESDWHRIRMIVEECNSPGRLQQAGLILL